MFYYCGFVIKILCWSFLIKHGTAYSGLEDSDNHDYYDYYFDYHPPINYDVFDYYTDLNGYHNHPYHDGYNYLTDDDDNSVYDFHKFDEDFVEEDDDNLGLDFKSEDELFSLIKELAESLENERVQVYNTFEGEFPILHRRKRGIRRSSSSRSSSSSSRSSSSSSSSRSRSSFGFRRENRERERVKPKPKQEEKKSEPVDKSSYPKASYPPLSPIGGSSSSSGYPKPSAPPLESSPIDKSSYPKASYPPLSPIGGSSSSSGYPKPSAPPLESSPIDKSSYPKASYAPQNPTPGGFPSAGTQSGGYPNQPHSGYPNQPSPGFPHQPSPGYPLQPSPGYPHQPSQGYPHQPSPGYPGQQPPSGYPIKPSSGYPHQTVPNYPHQPVPGYPIQPSPGYPYQPTSGYPTRGKPSLGIPPISGSYPSYPGAGYPKMSKKEKVISKVKQALEGYAMHKMHKKHNSRLKYISPGMGMGMGMHGFHGGGTMAGMAGAGSMKAGKKILGTIIKLQIAKYALKFGMKAAKAYFEYKLGRSIEERMIDKFISRYHKQRTRDYYRQNRWLYKNKKDFKQENITLGEDCIRDCKTGERLTCFFSFHVHLYQYLSRACYNCPNKLEDCGRPDCIVGSGRQKLVTVVNRQLPGPTIQVCEGDKILLEVHNELPSSGVTIHFRGQSYSEEPYMDGTIGLTSTIVAPGEIFAYRFKADVPGTHFWHANTGVMRSDGVYGALVVNGKTETLHEQYDSDLVNQTIIISEDFVKRGEEQLVNLYHKKGKIDVYSLLINGRGFKQDDSSIQTYSNSAYSEIKVLSGKRNRMRLISAVSSNCPVSFRIQGKSFTVISIDGFPVTPTEAQTLLISPGERIDIVVKDVSTGLHWIEIQGFLDCENHKQFAVLNSKESLVWLAPLPNDTKSETASSSLPTESPFTSFNEMEKLSESIVYCNNTKIVCSRNFSSTSPMPADLNTPNITLYLSLTSRPIHNEHYYSLIYYDIASLPVEEQSLTHQINNLTLRVAHEPLLINQRPLKYGVCSSAGVLRQHCVENFCECLHLLELPLRKTVEIVFINEGQSNSLRPQTMYLHGYNFWVLSQSKGFLPSNETLDNSTSPYLDRLRVIIRDAEEVLMKNIDHPVRMNSITIPEGGYSVIRFKADNPGFWLLESSSAFKSTNGMGMVLKVGEKKDLPEIPQKYAKC